MHRKQQGMSLLEVVVSMLLCGIGLAITVGMYQASLRHAQQAEYRAIAMREAQVLVDEMRANRLGAAGFLVINKKYSTNDKFDKSSDNLSNTQTILCKGKADEATCNQAVVNAAGKAEIYVENWRKTLEERIPSLVGSADGVKLEWGGDTQRTNYTLTIKWKTTVDETAKNSNAATTGSTPSTGTSTPNPEDDAVVVQFVL